MEYRYTKGASRDSRYIREVVFIEEQGFKEEFDSYDDYVDTLVIYDNGKPLATGRLYEEDNLSHTYKLGRIAVLKSERGKHLGSLIIESMEERAKSLGARVLHISAQVRAVHFYESCGYSRYGNTYYEEHVEHVAMKKIIEKQKELA